MYYIYLTSLNLDPHVSYKYLVSWDKFPCHICHQSKMLDLEKLSLEKNLHL